MSAPTPQTSSTATDTSTARFELCAEAFAFADLFERVPDARVEIEPAVANPDDHALLVVETDAHQRTVDAALRSSPSVAAVEEFGGQDYQWRYRVTWDDRIQRLMRRLVTENVTLIAAHGASGRWKLRLVASERTAIARAHEVLKNFGSDPVCLSITPLENRWSDRAGLTDKQHKALTRAFEMEYYDIPREVTAEELAADLDISHQALSERLRRAHRKLIDDANLVK